MTLCAFLRRRIDKLFCGWADTQCGIAVRSGWIPDAVFGDQPNRRFWQNGKANRNSASVYRNHIWHDLLNCVSAFAVNRKGSDAEASDPHKSRKQRIQRGGGGLELLPGAIGPFKDVENNRPRCVSSKLGGSPKPVKIDYDHRNTLLSNVQCS